jgi:hypothetical protein
MPNGWTGRQSYAAIASEFLHDDSTVVVTRDDVDTMPLYDLLDVLRFWCRVHHKRLPAPWSFEVAAREHGLRTRRVSTEPVVFGVRPSWNGHAALEARGALSPPRWPWPWPRRS